MGKFVTVNNINESFSDQNPEVHLHQPYKDLYKSLKKRKYDKVMMAIYLVFDPKSVSQRGNRSEFDCKVDIKENFLREPNFDWGKYSHIIKDYKAQSRTKLQIQLDELYKEIVDRLAYGKELTFKDNAKEKDRILLSHDTYLEKYMALKEKVDQEDNTKTRAGALLSRSEKRASKVNN